jgi:hypothetical protein
LAFCLGWSWTTSSYLHFLSSWDPSWPWSYHFKVLITEVEA